MALKSSWVFCGWIDKKNQENLPGFWISSSKPNLAKHGEEMCEKQGVQDFSHQQRGIHMSCIRMSIYNTQKNTPIYMHCLLLFRVWTLKKHPKHGELDRQYFSSQYRYCRNFRWDHIMIPCQAKGAIKDNLFWHTESSKKRNHHLIHSGFNDHIAIAGMTSPSSIGNTSAQSGPIFQPAMLVYQNVK